MLDLTDHAKALITEGHDMPSALAELRVAYLDRAGWADEGAAARAATAAAGQAYRAAAEDLQ